MRLLIAAVAVLFASGPAIAQKVVPVEGRIGRDGFELHYRVFGSSGPAVLVLAGGPGSDNRYMQPVCDELEASFRCIMLEQRGTGRSTITKYSSDNISWDLYIADIEAVRRHLGARQLVLIGNSWGSMLALLYGGSHPANAAAVVSVGSGPITSEYASVFAANRTSRLSTSELALRDYWQEPKRYAADPVRATYEIERAETSSYYYSRTRALAAAMELRPGDTNPYIFDALFEREKTFDLRPAIRKITAPTLLIQGRQDLAGEANIYEASLLITQSKLIFINKCGHLPWEERPAETWTAIKEFLASVKYQS